MAAPAPPSGSESRDTLLLYCPYDRKVTRHARRGPEGSVSCLECGRQVQASHVARQTPVTPIVSHSTTYAGPRSLRTHRAMVWRNRAHTPWVPFALVGAVTIAAIFTLFTMVGNPFGASGSKPSTASQAAAQAQTEPSSPSEPTAAARQPEAAAAAGVSTVRVANTDGIGAYLRRTTNLNDHLGAALREGTILKITGPDVADNGTTWKHVEDPLGNQGWMPAQYTEPAG